MNIAFVTHDHFRDQLGGADRSLLNLVDGLRPCSVNLNAIVSRKGCLLEELERRGVRCAIVPYVNSMSKISRAGTTHHGVSPARVLNALRICKRTFSYLLAGSRIARRLREWDADVVYSNSLVIAIGHFSSRLAGLPHIWHIREHPEAQWGERPYVGWPTYRRWLRQAAAVVAISEFVRSNVLGDGFSRSARVIYNGVGWRSDLLAKSRCHETKQALHSGFQFALAGAICEFKGHDIALRALSILRESGRDVSLVLAGGGELDWAKRIARDLGVSDRVTFQGQLSDCWGLWAQADAALMCSICEPMGRVTVEAMAAGLPVIGRNSGATPELITDGVTGLLYDGSPGDLARKMLSLIDDLPLAQRLGRSAALHATECFSTEAYCQRVFSLLDGIVPGGSQSKTVSPLRLGADSV